MASVAASQTETEQPLSRWQLHWFRFDTKAIVGAVLLGVVMVLIQEITERVDTAITGGTWFPLAGGTHSTVLVLSSIFYRLPGAWITGEMNAIAAVIFDNTPVGPAFAFNNFIYPIIAVAITRFISMRKWWHYAVLLIPSILIGYAPMIPISSATFHMPLSLAAWFQGGTDLAAFIIALIIAKPIADNIARSGVVD